MVKLYFALAAAAYLLLALPTWGHASKDNSRIDKVVDYFASKVVEAKTRAGMLSCKHVLMVCNHYREDHGAYPDTLETLVADEKTFFEQSELDRLKEGPYYSVSYVKTSAQHIAITATPKDPQLPVVFVDQTGLYRLHGPDGPVLEEKQ